MMRIAPENGGITLANGIEIGPGLTQDGFRALASVQGARSYNCGTLPYIHYEFSGGRMEDNPLLVHLCFYDQVLLYLEMTVDLYPPGPRDWSGYSLDVEAAIKRFHDQLLKAMFGKPSNEASLLSYQVPQGQEILEQPLRWDFPWGGVFSSHDSKGGGTPIVVRYGDRMEQADRRYRQHLGWALA